MEKGLQILGYAISATSLTGWLPQEMAACSGAGNNLPNLTLRYLDQHRYLKGQAPAHGAVWMLGQRVLAASDSHRNDGFRRKGDY